mmetsp:Transcript_15460/g.46764  ORF Transcript_15460/g.46764 Transcript_15460/m.46764 type:complete len:281 (+) Transcript_15460:74-916(+)
MAPPHFLEHRYSFFFMRRGEHRKSEASEASNAYASSIIKIGSFDSAEGFFSLYDHLLKPSSQACVGTDYHLFREGVTPTWEDPHNKNGGKFIIRLRKADGLSSLYWEELLLAIIGEQFGDLTDHISGAVVSIRANDDIISLWNVDANDHVANDDLKERLKQKLQLPNYVQLEYKKHALARTHVWHRQKDRPLQPGVINNSSILRSVDGGSGGGGGSGSHHHHHHQNDQQQPQQQRTHRNYTSNNGASGNRGDYHRSDRGGGNQHPPPSGDRDWSTLRKKA